MSADHEQRIEPVLSVPNPKEGEFEPSGRLTADRTRFLWLVSGMATHVLHDLMDTVAQVPETKREASLHEWAQRHHLDAAWIKNVARETAQAMAEPERWARCCDLSHRVQRLARMNGYGRPYDPDWMWVATGEVTQVFLGAAWNEEPFTFTHRPAYPDREKWGDYAEEAKGAFAKALRTHWDDCCNKLESEGRQKSARKRGEAKWAHIEWFIQSQICEKTHKEIADAGGIKETKRVAEACKDVAERIGLQRRTV